MTLCGQCGRNGHNRRTCPTRKRKAPTGAGATEDGHAAGDCNAKRSCGGGGGRAEASAALKGEEAPEEDDRLPPSGRLAFVNAMQPEFTRDFLLPCLCGDVDALIALVHTCASLRDLVARQLTRLDCSKGGWTRPVMRLTDGIVFDRDLCFLGANLLELDVSQNTFSPDDKLTDAGVGEIAVRCPNLRRFAARDCRLVRTSIKTLAYRCPGLQEVDLSFYLRHDGASHGITNDSLAALARRCRNLTVLKIGRATSVTDAGLEAIGAHCKKLTTLDLGQCDRVRDDGVIAVARGCAALTHLELGYCSKVTSVALAALAEHRGNALVYLGFDGCARVTEAAEIDLVKRCHALRGHLGARFALAKRYCQGIDGEDQDQAKAALHWQLCAEQIRARLLQDRQLFPEPPSAMRARFERERPTLLPKITGTVQVDTWRGKKEFSAAQEALGKAVLADDPDAIARAVASDADVEAKAYFVRSGSMGGSLTAVFVAASHNNLHALRFLLCAAAADPNADGGKMSYSSIGRHTPFNAACISDSYDAARILFALGARLNHDGMGLSDSGCTCPDDIPHSLGCTCVRGK